MCLLLAINLLLEIKHLLHTALFFCFSPQVCTCSSLSFVVVKFVITMPCLLLSTAAAGLHVNGSSYLRAS